ncbi:ricin-type beta-trefoil lectin domain protein [Mycobacterium scrofulaceum]|uniref:Rv1419 family lectin n=1 Tax=Mycobacterium scrofulaceum TaxID=1783 RepID=UPI003F6DCBE3
MHGSESLGGLGKAVGAVGAALGVVVLGAGPAAADGPVQVKSRLGDVCLDAPTGSWYSALLINPCNGSDFQRWNVNGLQLESVAFPGSCLTKPSDSAFARLGPCLNMPGQRWTAQPDGQVTTALLGACLTVLGGPDPATLVSTRWCNGDAGQGWDYVP